MTKDDSFLTAADKVIEFERKHGYRCVIDRDVAFVKFVGNCYVDVYVCSERIRVSAGNSAIQNRLIPPQLMAALLDGYEKA